MYSVCPIRILNAIDFTMICLLKIKDTISPDGIVFDVLNALTEFNVFLKATSLKILVDEMESCFTHSFTCYKLNCSPGSLHLAENNSVGDQPSQSILHARIGKMLVRFLDKLKNPT